jgi:hypothetical protein
LPSRTDFDAQCISGSTEKEWTVIFRVEESEEKSVATTHQMGFLANIVFCSASSWIVVSLFRRLRRQHAAAGSWLAFALLIVCGLAIGFWCAFYAEYHLGTRFRIGSFPLPAVIFHLEDGQWVDFPVPALQGWLTMITNVFIITALTALPLRLVSGHQQNYCNNLRNTPT